MNREHKSDRDSKFDPVNDDLRDPFVFGEDPRSRVLSGRPSTARKRKRSMDPAIVGVVQQWRARNPQGTAAQCREYLHSKGWESVPMAGLKWALSQSPTSPSQK